MSKHVWKICERVNQLFLEKCLGLTAIYEKYLCLILHSLDASPHIWWSVLRHATNWILWVLGTTPIALMCCLHQVLTSSPLVCDLGTEAKLFFLGTWKTEPNFYCRVSQRVRGSSCRFLRESSVWSFVPSHPELCETTGIKYSRKPALVGDAQRFKSL